MSWLKMLFLTMCGFALCATAAALYLFHVAELDYSVPMYVDNCSQCHGDALQGSDRGVALIGAHLSGGDNVAALQASIKGAHSLTTELALEDLEIQGLANYIAERRLGQRFTEFQFDKPVNVPRDVQSSELHDFAIETLIDGLSPLIFSIAPLPNGSLLVSEKQRGLSRVTTNGIQSEVVKGTPRTGNSFSFKGVQVGSGWLLDVAIHPNYESNGWVYLHYTDLCDEVCPGSIIPQAIMPRSMNRLDRGRIVDGRWVDVETIWQAPREFYAATPDTGAGGRIAFDDSGHVYISVGVKSSAGLRDTTAQDLSSPYGKIHRVRDDGSIPLDNPFATDPARHSIWTFGHRSPQGLEWHPVRKRVWNSEMGPRGGDELNELLPGKNYGWPFHSLGLEYLGSQVERHKPKNIEFDVSQVEQTLVDITPSPAISSFVVYSGAAFPGWQNNVLIGSLKGSSLFRMVFDGKKFLRQETLIKDLARIRDVEVGFDGLVYLLLENAGGSSIVRLSPRGSAEIAATTTVGEGLDSKTVSSGF